MEEFCGDRPTTGHKDGNVKSPYKRGHDVSCPHGAKCVEMGRRLLLAGGGVGEELVRTDDLAVERAGDERVALDVAGLRIRDRDVVHL